MIVHAADRADAQAIADWTAARIEGCGGFRPPFHAAAVMQGRRLVAGLVYNEFRPEYGTMQLSVAADSPRWALPGTFREMFRYPFADNGVNKLWSLMRADNGPVIRLAKGIGMKQEAVLRHQFGPGRHAVLFSMLAKEWRASRWAKEMRHG